MYICCQLLNDQLTVTSMQPVLCPRASQLIAAYDEHVLVSQFKFGVLYQRFGQTSEEQLFSNRHGSPAFDEFLSLLGQRIQLKDHKGLVVIIVHCDKDVYIPIYAATKEASVIYIMKIHP